MIRIKGYSIKYLFSTKIKILAYHSVGPVIANDYSITTDNFIKQMDILKNKQYRVISLEEAYFAIKNNNIKRNTIVLTFDDAYKELVDWALPILREYKYPVTIFAPFAYLGKYDGFSFDEIRKDIRILSLNDIRSIKKIFYQVSFGSHTMNHKNLLDLSVNDLDKEFTESLKILKNDVGEDFLALAYPFGMFDSKIKKMVEAAGYKSALAFGNIMSNYAGTDMFELRREKILNSTSISQFKKKINPNFDLIRKSLKKN